MRIKNGADYRKATSRYNETHNEPKRMMLPLGKHNQTRTGRKKERVK